jgi:hypothetical protein
VRALRRILLLAVLVVVLGVVRERLLAADEARTGFSNP